MFSSLRHLRDTFFYAIILLERDTGCPNLNTINAEISSLPKMRASEASYEMARDEARHGKALEGMLKI